MNSEILPSGTCLGAFRIESPLGQGNNGVVYRATQLNLDRPVALKIIPNEFAENESFVKAFFKEAQAAAAFSHQHIVQAFDVGKTPEGTYYFAMEMIDGGDINKRLKIEDSIETITALKLLSGIAEGLEYGHQTRGLTHGDIKPANILLTKTGVAKLADLGLARMQGEGGRDVVEEIELTPNYAAPEMIKNKWKPGDARADIYSYGATLYHMITGAPPFTGENYRIILNKHLEQAPTSLTEVFDECPDCLDKFVLQLLHKDPRSRPQSWSEVLRLQRQLIARLEKGDYEDPKEKVLPHSSPRSKRRHVRKRKAAKKGGGLKLLLLLLLLLIGLGIFVLQSQSVKARQEKWQTWQEQFLPANLELRKKMLLSAKRGMPSFAAQRLAQLNQLNTLESESVLALNDTSAAAQMSNAHKISKANFLRAYLSFDAKMISDCSSFAKLRRADGVSFSNGLVARALSPSAALSIKLYNKPDGRGWSLSFFFKTESKHGDLLQLDEEKALMIRNGRIFLQGKPLGGESVNDGQWHHLCLSSSMLEAGLCSLYIDGELHRSFVDEVKLSDAFKNLTFFAGVSYDELRIYTRALCASEAAKLEACRILDPLAQKVYPNLANASTKSNPNKGSLDDKIRKQQDSKLLNNLRPLDGKLREILFALSKGSIAFDDKWTERLRQLFKLQSKGERVYLDNLREIASVRDNLANIVGNNKYLLQDLDLPALLGKQRKYELLNMKRDSVELRRRSSFGFTIRNLSFKSDKLSVAFWQQSLLRLSEKRKLTAEIAAMAIMAFPQHASRFYANADNINSEDRKALRILLNDLGKQP